MNKDKIDITVLGTGSSSHEMVIYIVKKYLDSAGIVYDLKEVRDIATFLERNLASVPCIYIDDEYLPIGANSEFNKSLRKAIKLILKKQNFGDMEKIIIPIDFSDVSTNAFMFGHRLATDLGAVVKALHVFMPTSKELYESSVVDLDFIKLRKSRLNDFVQDYDKDWASDIMSTSIIDSEFRTGFPGDEILNSVEDNAAELIVMGTTGDSGNIKKWFGSVSTKIMNESLCPVLLVPENAAYKGVKNILYAFDDIKLDTSIIDQLVQFSQKFDAKLHLVHVNNAESTDPGYYLEELVKENYSDNKIINSSLYNENVVDALEEYAEMNNIDIIAMGTRNRSFFERIFHKSITKKMALQSSIPLLILKLDEK